MTRRRPLLGVRPSAPDSWREAVAWDVIAGIVFVLAWLWGSMKP